MISISWKDQIFESYEDGKPRGYLSEPMPEAVASKTMHVYLNIAEVTDDARIKVVWAHSADGASWVKEEQTAMIDTGDGTPASAKPYDGNNGSTLMGAMVRLLLTIEHDAATPDTLQTCTASVYTVFKPF